MCDKRLKTAGNSEMQKRLSHNLRCWVSLLQTQRQRLLEWNRWILSPVFQLRLWRQNQVVLTVYWFYPKSKLYKMTGKQESTLEDSISAKAWNHWTFLTSIYSIRTFPAVLTEPCVFKPPTCNQKRNSNQTNSAKFWNKCQVSIQQWFAEVGHIHVQEVKLAFRS